MTQADRNPLLARLDVLIGEWEMQATFGGVAMPGRGRTTFEWLEDRAFLVQRADAELPEDAPPGWAPNWPFPVTVIIGADDRTQRFSYVYADARPVHRVYEMSLEDRVWKIWGQSGPEFFQRFSGAIDEDGNTITASWEKSADGSTWELDLELIYTRIE